MYSTYDHSLTLDVVYSNGGVVVYNLDHSYVEEHDTCCTDITRVSELDVDLNDLTGKQMTAIAEGEECVCGDLRIRVDELRDEVLLQRFGRGDITEKHVAIPRRYYGKVRKEILRAVSDADLMLQYLNIDRGNECLVVADPKAQRVLVLACLHAAFRGDDWDRSNGIHNYLDDESELRSIDGRFFVTAARRLVDTLTPVDVNNILKGSGCQIYHKPSKEPVVKRLFKDRDRVIDNLLYGRLSPSGEYFAHFQRCSKRQAEELESRCICKVKGKAGCNQSWKQQGDIPFPFE